MINFIKEVLWIYTSEVELDTWTMIYWNFNTTMPNWKVKMVFPWNSWYAKGEMKDWKKNWNWIFVNNLNKTYWKYRDDIEVWEFRVKWSDGSVWTWCVINWENVWQREIKHNDWSIEHGNFIWWKMEWLRYKSYRDWWSAEGTKMNGHPHWEWILTSPVWDKAKVIYIEWRMISEPMPL